MSEDPQTLLNIYDVEAHGTLHHLICLLEPDRADACGIAPCAIVGKFVPDRDGGFDPRTFEANPTFIDAFARYMNDEGPHSLDLIAEASHTPGDWLFLIDSRTPDADPAPGAVLGRFDVDDRGRIVPGSFEYSPDHRWFDPQAGPSGVLSSRDFYDWLHAARVA